MSVKPKAVKLDRSLLSRTATKKISPTSTLIHELELKRATLAQNGAAAERIEECDRLIANAKLTKLREFAEGKASAARYAAREAFLLKKRTENRAYAEEIAEELGAVQLKVARINNPLAPIPPPGKYAEEDSKFANADKSAAAGLPGLAAAELKFVGEKQKANLAKLFKEGDKKGILKGGVFVSRYAAPGHAPLPIASASQVASGGEEEEATDDDESEGTSRKRRRTVSAKKATPPKKRRTSSGSASGSSGKKKKGGSAKATTESETDDEEADEDLPGSAASSITALNALVDPTSKYSLNAAQREILRKSKNLTLEQSDLIRGSKVAEKGAKQKNIARKIREAEEHETKQRRKEIEDVVSAARKLSATQTPLIVAARKKRGGPNLTPAQILDLAEQFKKEARIELGLAEGRGLGILRTKLYERFAFPSQDRK
jgi:hypothetical protein